MVCLYGIYNVWSLTITKVISHMVYDIQPKFNVVFYKVKMKSHVLKVSKLDICSMYLSLGHLHELKPYNILENILWMGGDVVTVPKFEIDWPSKLAC